MSKRALLAAVFMAVTVTMPNLNTTTARAVTSRGNDQLLTGWYPNQPGLSPGNVSGGNFGQLFNVSVDAAVQAQPLVSQGVLVVATENNSVYGFDAVSGAQLWMRNLGVGWHTADVACDNEINGVTGTPVIDTSTNTVYLLSKTYRTGTSGPAAWLAHALDLNTGVERAGFPVDVHGTAANDPSTGFDATHQQQRAGLLLLNGVVYAGFGSLCDATPYQGWIVGISPGGSLTTLWTTLANGAGASAAGVWQSGAGLLSDGNGIVFTTGNGMGQGHSPAMSTPGTQPPGQLAQSVVRLAVQPDGSLKAVDFFSPYDADNLDGWDADLGSGGLAGLPPQYFGTAAYPHLAVQAGKQGYFYLLNLDNLGGRGMGPQGSDLVVDRVGPYGGVWSTPAVWPGDGGYFYVPTASDGSSGTGSNGYLKAFAYGLDGTGKPAISLAGTSSDGFGYGSSAAVVTSNGTSSGSALVWTVWQPDRTGMGSELRAYDPVPVNGVLQVRARFPVGQGIKFNPPAVDSNRVYVATRDGHVRAFGSPVNSPLIGSLPSFPNTIVGQSSTQTLTLTAQQPLTVTGASTGTAAFTVGAPTPSFPANLQGGDAIQMDVTFTPAKVAMASGTLTVQTSAGALSIPLAGRGLSASAQLLASVPSLSMGGVTVGQSQTQNITFSNQGAQPLTINGTASPSAPFSASGLPPAGATIAPTGSVTVGITFAPTATGLFSDQLTVSSTGGNVSVPFSATAQTPAQLIVNPGSIDFGDTPIGTSKTATFTIQNVGGSTATINKSKPPAVNGFDALSSLAEGTTIASGASLTETVRFTPAAAGPANGQWTITGDDVNPAHSVPLTGNGVDPNAVAGNGTNPNAGNGSNPTPAPGSTFYFAEGYTAPGFHESLEMFSPTASGVATITYYTAGGRSTEQVPMAAGTNVSVDVNQAVGAWQTVSAQVTLPGPGVVERKLSFDHGAWQGSDRKVGVSAPSSEWDFAEGSTLSVFSEYLILENPNDSPVMASLEYHTDTGLHPTKTLQLPASSRTTVEVFRGRPSDTGGCDPGSGTCGVGPGFGGVSVRVTTPQGSPIVVEEPFYVNGYSFGSGLIRDGDVVPGASGPLTSWYFADGTTLSGFYEYLTLLNPGDGAAHVTLDYQLEDGRTLSRNLVVPGSSRSTVQVFDGINGVGVGVGGVSVHVSSDQPIVAGRSLYVNHDFGAGPVQGVASVAGSPALGTRFEFTGGATQGGEADYLTIQNPGGVAANLTVTYHGSVPVTRTFTVGAHQRSTVEVFGSTLGAGPGQAGLGIVVTADQPVLVEMPTYSASSPGGSSNTLGYFS